MKGKIFFFILTFICIGTALWAANSAFQLKGTFFSPNGWSGISGSTVFGGYPGKVIFDTPATAQINTGGILAGSFWLGNVGWVSFDHGVGLATAQIDCPLDILNNATQICPITGSAWSQNAGWIVFGSGAIGAGSGIYYNPNTSTIEGWGWNRSLGWIPIWTGFSGTILPDPTVIADPLDGAPVNFISKIAIVGNIAGSRVFSVSNNAIVNQDVGYSYRAINHANTLNFIRKNIALISRNISDAILDNSNPNNINFVVKKNADFRIENASLTPYLIANKRSIIVIGGDIVIDQDYVNSINWSQSPIGLIALKDALGNGGNIIIGSKTKRIYAYMYAEGSVFSGEKTNGTITPYVVSGIWNVPQNQLYIRGLIASKNTIGGAQQKDGTISDPVCPALTSDCTPANSHYYDLNYFRTYDSTDSTQSALPPERSSVTRIKDAVMIIEYDPRILTDPPPGWNEAK